ncbi:phospholipase [Xylaria intraflava]|nr:phospholipase [Xylaria intraflava]
MDEFLRRAEHVVKDHILGDILGIENPEGHNHQEEQQHEQHEQYEEHKEEQHEEQEHIQTDRPDIRPVDTSHRFQSFAPRTTGDVKWYVDGASYFWAVSMALREARESIYILDWWLSPELYLRRPPSSNEQYRLDNMLRAAAERGVEINVIVYKEHTKHALEALHPNIKVFRHPDHLPTSRARLEQAFSGLSLDMKMNTFSLSKVPKDALKELYGSFGDTVLYWAHHEKLCIVDRHLVFMGGLDLCFGRYDTNSHPIADAHPGNLDAIIFPGQDFNNARLFDFEGVNNWDHNQLDRAKNSRMGWSDISISLKGPIVHNLIDHFTDRWNFIFDEKYREQNPGKYTKFEQTGGDDTRGLRDRFNQVRHYVGGESEYQEGYEDERPRHHQGKLNIQLCRSACEWSSGHPTEHSIANAYIHAIESAQHFVYIENQFFITATGNEQHPVQNKIGASIVSRIVRAHTNEENFRIIIVIPAVPAFAGDLKADSSLGTRAIMEYQYNSINRGGHSIIEKLKENGVQDWRRYISFYNLRNYDRINISSTMRRAEDSSGVRYDDARREGQGEYDEYEGRREYRGPRENYDRYQSAASRIPDQTQDTVSASYMDGGPDIRSVPWDGDEESELNAFVSEELYVHSKVLIADDRLVICGSANLNDRSQLGTHDSEIAVVVEGQDFVDSTMDGRQYTASQFATSLRRQLWRKHLGWLPNQRVEQPTQNWTPITRDPQEYDWGSDADRAVEDPLSDRFWRAWTETARTNTEVFSKVFHNVPNDNVRTWDEYDEFFSRHFVIPGTEDKDKDDKGDRVEYGHVVREEFPGGVAEVKDWLSRVRGTLVEMPLDFLIEVKDLAKEGLSLNALTDEIYT